MLLQYIHCTTTYFNTRDLKPDGLNGRTAESHSTADLDLLYVADILRKELDVLMAGRQGEGRGREEVRLIIGRELYSVHRSVTLKIIIIQYRVFPFEGHENLQLYCEPIPFILITL